MTYVPNATDQTEPTESRTVESAAADLRAIKAEYKRSLRTPAGDSAPTVIIPTVALRAGKALAFDAFGSPVPVALSGAVDPSLRADLALPSGWQLVGGLSDIPVLSKLTEINGGALAGFRNKLIGGHFDTNPWQRGTTIVVTVSGTYVADQWLVEFDGTANITVEKVALPTPQRISGVWCRYGLKFTVNSKAGNTFIRLVQRIEGVDTLTEAAAVLQTAILGSAPVTVPVQFRQYFGPAGSGDVVTAANSLAVTAGLQLLGAGTIVPTIALKTVTTNDYVAVIYDLTAVPAANYVLIALAGLEPGTEVAKFEQRPKAAELVLCQRYYEVSDAIPIFSGYVTPGNLMYHSAGFKVTKRVTPTMVLSNISTAGFPATAPTANYIGTEGYIVGHTSNGTFPNGLYRYSWTASAVL